MWAIENPKDFEHALSVRSKVPPQHLSGLIDCSESRVQHEAKSVERILKRFAQAVVGRLDDAVKVDSFLQELDLKCISKDHDWRTIFAEIRTRDGAFDEHKRILLVKYTQYLSFRKELLDFICQKRAGLEKTTAHANLDVLQAWDESEQSSGVSIKVAIPKSFGRLPLGETVEIPIASTGSLDIHLAGRRFRLSGGRHPCLVAESGNTYFLLRGRNIIGRHPESDVVVDPNFHDVSRTHLLIEWDGEQFINLMDLSSRGTYLPAELIFPPQG